MKSLSREFRRIRDLSGYSNSISIYDYETIEDFKRRFPKELEEVTKFINGHLSALSIDWGIRVPPWGFHSGIIPGIRGIDLRFSIWFLPAFRVERKDASLVLKYAIAHEFRHWLTIAKHIRIPLPRRPKYRPLRWMWSELEASAFGFRYSGITHERAWRLWRKILDKIEAELGIPVPR